MVSLLRELGNGKIMKYPCQLCADFRFCCDVGQVRILLAGLFVIIAGSDLGNIARLAIFDFGNQGQLGMHFIRFKAVNDGAARFFQLFGVINIILLVKTCAQLYHHDNFFAVFGGGNQRLNNFGFMRHTVQRHFDGNNVRVIGGAAQHNDKRANALVRVRQQNILVLNSLC